MNDRISPTDVAELFRLAADRFEEHPAFVTRKTKSEWKPLSFRELYETGAALATALIELGAEALSHIGLFADNRKEWILADCATQLCGAADVPRAADVTEAELAYIINHAEIRIAFVETDRLQKKLLKLKDQLPTLQTIILMDSETIPDDSVLKFYDLVDKGDSLRKNG